jgi:hypothetical protein
MAWYLRGVSDSASLPLPPDPVIEAYKRDVDRTLLRENLRLTWEERLLALQQLQELAAELGAAGRRLRGRA